MRHDLCGRLSVGSAIAAPEIRQLLAISR